MPINAGPEFQKAQEEYALARSLQEKLTAVEKMLKTAPKHKSSEKLLAGLKERRAKIRKQIETQRQQKKGGTNAFSVKKEGAAQVVLVGATNTGKSTLLQQLTGAQVEIASYKFTTKKPEVGILDYHGVKIQVVEIPAIVDHFADTKAGPSLLSIIRNADLMIYLFRTAEEKALLDRELADVGVDTFIYNNQENLSDLLWRRLGLIKICTKQPGKEKDYPPLPLAKGSTVEDVVKTIHKDFIKRFRFARVFGKSAKFDGQQVGLSHALQDDDVVEFHIT